MKRLLHDSRAVRRSNLSLAILVAVFLYGFWELWLAAAVTGSATGYVFALLFLGGAAWGIRALLAETRDLGITLEADTVSGQARIALWQPFHMKHIDTTLDRLSDWRHGVQTASRDRQVHFLLAREASRDGVLRFTLEPGMSVADELRRLAPEAIAEFERESGWKEI